MQTENGKNVGDSFVQTNEGNLQHLLPLVFIGYTESNPGYGFHSDYTHQQQHAGGRAANNTGGGFWTGMASGGMLGYLFGRQRSAQRRMEIRISDRNML